MAFGKKGLKKKKTSLDTWSTKEQLYLASTVLKSDNRKWTHISQQLKSSLEKEFERPYGWFFKNNCIAQHAYLLSNVDSSKRKKKKSDDTIDEFMARSLTQKRMEELHQMLVSLRKEYQQLKREVNFFKTAHLSEEKLDKMWLEIELEDTMQKSNAHKVGLAKQKEQIVNTDSNFKLINQRSRKRVNSSKSTSVESHRTLFPSYTNKEEMKNMNNKPLLLSSSSNAKMTQTISNQDELASTPIVNKTTLYSVKPASGPDSEMIDHSDNEFLQDINIDEMIANIEDLIEGKVKDDLQILDCGDVGVIESFSPQPTVAPNKQENKNVPAIASLSFSPESEIYSKDIDATSINITEIIGLLAEKNAVLDFKEIKPKSKKEVEVEISLQSSESSQIEKAEELTKNSKVGIETRLEGGKGQTMKDRHEINAEINGVGAESISSQHSKGVESKSGEKIRVENIKKSVNSFAVIDERIRAILREYVSSHREGVKEDLKISVKEDTKTANDNAKKETQQNVKENVLQVQEDSHFEELKLTSEKENSREKVIGQEKVLDREEVDGNKKMEKLELNLVKIAGEENMTTIDVLSVSSDHPLSMTDQKISEDISLFLKNEKIFPNLQKEENDEVSVVGLATDSTEFSAPSKEDDAIIKEVSREDEKEEIPEKNIEESEEVSIDTEDFKDFMGKEKLKKVEENDHSKETEELLPKKEEKKVKENIVLNFSVQEGRTENDDYSSWKRAVMLIYDKLATHKDSIFFIRPVSWEYGSIILKPMDLPTIKRNIENGIITSTKHFQRDVMLMFQNIIMLNEDNSRQSQLAKTMQEEFLQHLQNLQHLISRSRCKSDYFEL